LDLEQSVLGKALMPIECQEIHCIWWSWFKYWSKV